MDRKNGYTREELLKAGDSTPERGPRCHHCQSVIPQFADLAESDERRVLHLVQQNRPLMAMEELRRATGFEMTKMILACILPLLIYTDARA